MLDKKRIVKIAVVSLVILCVCIVAFIISIAINSENSKPKDIYITTQYGDNFKISVDEYLGKATISNSKYRFSVRIPYYVEGDSLSELCDTANITCYKINGLKICKIKSIDKMVLISPNVKRDEDIYSALKKILTEDSVAREYISEDDLSNDSR